MSQHFKSNTDLSNNSNFDDAIGIIHDLSHQESNATDESSTNSNAVLLPIKMLQRMGLNHLQSSPLQQLDFVNPNINAPKLVIPSKVQLPPDITPGNMDEKRSNNNYNHIHKNENDSNYKPASQLSLDEDDENEIPHPIPITPNTDLSYNFQLPQGISPKTFTQTDIANIAEINQFIPQFWQCFQDLATNVKSMQLQFSKLNGNKSLHSSSQSSTHSSANSLRTQTSIASSYNNTLNSLQSQGIHSHGVIYSNSTNDSYNAQRRDNAPGTGINTRGRGISPVRNINKNEKSSLRRNRKLSPVNSKNKVKKQHLLGAQRQSITYNNYSQYRRKSIGPGSKFATSPKSRNGSISPFSSSPKAALTADSLELLQISQRHASKKMAENSGKNVNRRQRNRSKSFVASKHKENSSDVKKKRRTTIADANENKMADDDAFSDDDGFFDDEVSLYSDKLYSTVNSIDSQANIPQGLSIIHSASDHSNNLKNKNVLFEEQEGNGDNKLSNKFNRKKKENGYIKSRKPSSAASNSSTSGHGSFQSQFSISSIAVTDTDNDHIILSRSLSRSVPHSPDSNQIKLNKAQFKDVQKQKMNKNMQRRASQGASTGTHYLYPTQQTPMLIQSHSAHNIHSSATATPRITATATYTPQRPNTPTKQTPNTPLNTPNTTAMNKKQNNIISPPTNAYDINAFDNKRRGSKGKRKNSLTPPQEDKEQDYTMNIVRDDHGQRAAELNVEPLMFLDDNIGNNRSDDDISLYNDKIVILDDDEMIINGDKIQELPGYGDEHVQHAKETNDRQNVVEQVANILYATSTLPLTKYADGQSPQNGEDSVSISMNSIRYENSRPTSTKLNKNVHFDMNALNAGTSMNDIEEHKESADEDNAAAGNNIVNHHNLLPSQVKNHKKKSRNGKREKLKITKLKNPRGNLRKLVKLRLSPQNLRAHNGLNQLKNKLMDAKLEKKDVAKMTNEQLNEMLIYINRIQWLILDEKQKRESCLICGIQTNAFVLLLPCKHQSICANCANNVNFKDCPTCNKSVTQTILPRK